MKPVLPRNTAVALRGAGPLIGPNDEGPSPARGPAALVLDEALRALESNKAAALFLDIDESSLSKARRGRKSIPWETVAQLLRTPETADAFIEACRRAANRPVQRRGPKRSPNTASVIQALATIVRSIEGHDMDSDEDVGEVAK